MNDDMDHDEVLRLRRELAAVRSDLHRANTKLAELEAAKTDVARELDALGYSISHDLRAPLRSIDGFSLALLEDYEDQLDAEGKKYLSFVRASVGQMARMIDGLLALSRISRSELNLQEVDLSALARDAIARLRTAQPDRAVDVAIEEALVSEGDSRLLAIAFDHLFGNAWKFTKQRAVAHIEFGAFAREGRRVHFVRDDGAGFEKEFVHKLFGVFQRLHVASEFEGDGIGLATVQRVFRRHGGRVWAEGDVDRGATFYFTLHEKERAA